MKVYIRSGDNAKTAKSVKGRRRLSSVLDDKPLELHKKYPVDLSKGKLNLVVIPDKGTKPGEAKLKFEYNVDGEKLPPPPPPTPPKKEEPKKKEEGGGTNVILIAACGVLLVLVLVCCFLYIQYKNKLTKQK